MTAPSPSPINFAKVSATVWRGGRPDAEQGAWLYSAGVRTVLNLEWEASDDSAFAGIPVRLVRVRDFEPLPWFAPSVSDEHVIAALRAIRAGPPICYVHCRQGSNRTGVIIAAYRLIELGDALSSVLVEFTSYRGFWAWGDERYIRTLDRARVYFRHWLGAG